MIESVNSSSKSGNTTSVMKVPKNVRQVGQVNDIKKIYVEDYVMSYIKKVGTKKDSSSELVVLLGQFVRINNCQCTFISGAIEIKDALYDDNLVFTNEMWTEIYDTIKQYFSNVEIVGWSIIRAGLPLNVDQRIRKVHIDNFAGQNKTLLLYDSLEREEVFYVFEGNILVRQEGYYIFYDKNADMQNYIADLRNAGRQENKQEQNVFTTARPAVERKEASDGVFSKVKKKSGLMYGIGAAAAVVVLVISAATLNSYDSKSRTNQGAVGVISDNIKEQEVNSGGVVTTDQMTLPVETAQGKLATINNDENNEEVIEATPKASVKDKEDTAVKEGEEAESKDAKSEENPKEEVESKPDDTKPDDNEEKANEASTTENYYTVKKGDTLISIAVKLYDSKSYVSKIKELNGIEDSNKIKVGQKLLLP